MDVACANWRKSTRSGSSGSCVEVADNLPGVVGVRDSKDSASPVLVFGRTTWRDFIMDAKNGKFDR